MFVALVCSALHTRRYRVIQSKQFLKTVKVVFNCIQFYVSFIQTGRKICYFRVICHSAQISRIRTFP
jgi:hypothetical protein